MSDYELYHYGVKGMKWGVRRTAAQLGNAVKTGYKRTKQAIDSHNAKVSAKKAAKTAKERSKITSAKKLTDEELNARIKRMNLEKEYINLLKETEDRHVSAGKKVLQNILEKSTENIGTQTVTYLMGTGVNKLAAQFFEDNIVNPKKGQKDK